MAVLFYDLIHVSAQPRVLSIVITRSCTLLRYRNSSVKQLRLADLTSNRPSDRALLTLNSHRQWTLNRSWHGLGRSHKVWFGWPSCIACHRANSQNIRSAHWPTFLQPTLINESSGQVQCMQDVPHSGNALSMFTLLQFRRIPIPILSSLDNMLSRFRTFAKIASSRRGQRRTTS